jgi:uncharacterized membrane protein
MWTARTKTGWSLLLVGAVLMTLLAARYYSFDPEAYFPRQRQVYEAKTVGLMVHISGMIVAVLAGPFQFLRRLRERHFGFHRMLGKLYIAGAIVGGLGGLYMAQFSASGTPSDLGFALLALGVLLTTTIAFVRIRSGMVQSHREWMTRSYALIFAAITLRLYLPLLEGAFGEHDGYAIVAWACWLPNLAFAEWLIRARLRVHPEAPRVRPARVEPAIEGEMPLDAAPGA